MTSKFVRRLKKHRTRLRKMGLPTNPMMPSRRWSEVLAGARAFEEIREHMMERMLADIENERPLAPWIDGPWGDSPVKLDGYLQVSLVVRPPPPGGDALAGTVGEDASRAILAMHEKDPAEGDSGWRSTPSPFESPWRVGGGYAQIDPDAHINNLVILKHPLDRDEDGSEVPLTTPRKPSTFGE